LWAAGGGYGSGATPLTSVSSDRTGGFKLGYSCSAASPVIYITALGGTAGTGEYNLQIGLMAVAGPCGSLSSSPSITINELTTVAAEWALAPFIDPVAFEGGYWCDGGIVDIFPVRPVLDIEEPCDLALAINGFYPPRFAGEDASGWEQRRGSILYVASQVRTCQQIELARTNLSRLRRQTDVVMIEPVAYDKVRGAGFYRQFLTTQEWADFMRAGRADARRALAAAAHTRRTAERATRRAAAAG